VISKKVILRLSKGLEGLHPEYLPAFTPRRDYGKTRWNVKKSQIPSTKQQTNSKFQAPNPNRRHELWLAPNLTIGYKDSLMEL
jgi:hypothetical protein